MARSHIAAALAVAFCGILITFHLISQFGLPNVGFFHFHEIRTEATASPYQVPLGPTVSRTSKTEDDGSMYLIGTGKADITGYSYSALHSAACRTDHVLSDLSLR